MITAGTAHNSKTGMFLSHDFIKIDNAANCQLFPIVNPG